MNFSSKNINEGILIIQHCIRVVGNFPIIPDEYILRFFWLASGEEANSEDNSHIYKFLIFDCTKVFKELFEKCNIFQKSAIRELLEKLLRKNLENRSRMNGEAEITVALAKVFDANIPVKKMKIFEN